MKFGEKNCVQSISFQTAQQDVPQENSISTTVQRERAGNDLTFDIYLNLIWYTNHSYSGLMR